MLTVVKPSKVRSCLDPRDYNHAIYSKTEHYQMTALGVVANHLDKAKLFTEVDVKAGFWQKNLDLKSSYKNHNQESFWWLPMAIQALPFGMSPSPKVLHRSMHKFILELQGVEVIAGDFIIACLGHTKEDFKTLDQYKRSYFTSRNISWLHKVSNQILQRYKQSPPWTHQNSCHTWAKQWNLLTG